jgi:hypothetical protein
LLVRADVVVCEKLLQLTTELVMAALMGYNNEVKLAIIQYIYS